YSTERTSKANTDAINKKHMISAFEPAQNRTMGHHIDVIYTTSDTEIGCIEIGKGSDQTKVMKDGLVKLLLVMHDDLLLQLATTEEALRKTHVISFVILGLCNLPVYK
ncbi:hypothetical protein BDB00DRAFT_769279, partial [Zychaea mexicana]|uniref:uncharacterized protein n=1 Tax=Zychaea mexicana TaxID=64656 RepID=UPI0022FEAEA5